MGSVVEPPWISWSRTLPPDRWEEWRRRAEGFADSLPLEAALERAWRDMAGEAPAAPPRAVYAVLDLETGGLDPQLCAICSVAVMTLSEDLSEVTRYQRLVRDDVGKRYDPEAMAVNGLSIDRLRAEGTPVGTVLDDLRRGLPGKTVVAHNARFDLGFLATRGIEVPKWICTLDLSRRVLRMRSCKLAAVAERLGVERGTAHDAMGDAETTANVFRELMRRHI